MGWLKVEIRVPGKTFLTLYDVAELTQLRVEDIRRLIADRQFPAPLILPPDRMGEDMLWSGQAVGIWMAWVSHAPRPEVAEAIGKEDWSERARDIDPG